MLSVEREEASTSVGNDMLKVGMLEVRNVPEFRLAPLLSVSCTIA